MPKPPSRFTSMLPGGEMRLGQYRPSEPLLQYVASYWTIDVDRPPATVTVVPDGYVDITLELGERARLWVTGPQREPASYTHRTETHLLGASLLPGSALPILGVSAGSLAPE